MMIPMVICPNCREEAELNNVITAQSNQNIIFECPKCHYICRDIETSKG
ncbi:putative Zn finger protein [Cytobacillus purgationiresistens]|uniref:Zn finger protein n=1 Tax=Cytobacillus purgationiresistens TaxID=863449 RepID=A0ABU0AIE1_9BACI|nr:putative Zn finger protein [Cytobacillus purgationiresistens]